MSRKRQTLDELRQEIDEIDDALHDLLMRRADVTRAVAGIKRPSAGGRAVAPGGAVAPAVRPAREAQILRRLLARHRGDMPPSVIVRIWREIIAASLQAQAKFHLHVFGGENQNTFFDLAHAYFGALTPIRAHAKSSLVAHACAEEPDSLGIVPLPESDDGGAPWWAQLASAGQPGPRIIARLPFLNGDESYVAAYVLGSVEQEPSGDDTTLLRLETAEDLSRARLTSLLKDAGFEATMIAAGHSAEKGQGSTALLAVAGFVAASDPRLAVLRQDAGEQLTNVDLVGGFANPFAGSPSRDSQ